MKLNTFSKNVLLLLIPLLVIGSIFFYKTKKEKTKKTEYFYLEAIDGWNKGHKSKAEQFIASAIKNNDLAEYNYTAYKFLAYQNKKTLSHFYIKRAADLDENNPLYQYKAAIYAATEDYKVSLDYIEDALKQDPKNCLYLSHKASMLMRLDKDKEAMNSFRECLKNDPACEMVWNNLAFHSRRLDGHQKAIEVMQEAVTGNPDSAYLWYQKALYEKEPDLIDEAVISLETSIDVKPELGKQAAKFIHKLTGRNYQGKYKAIVKGLMQELPFKLQGNHVYLYTKIMDKAGWFLLDTGASTTIIYERFLRINKLKLAP